MNIEAKELSKIYGSGENRVVALDKVKYESIVEPAGAKGHKIPLPTKRGF